LLIADRLREKMAELTILRDRIRQESAALRDKDAYLAAKLLRLQAELDALASTDASPEPHARR
jgi:hypothetical protein